MCSIEMAFREKELEKEGKKRKERLTPHFFIGDEPKIEGKHM